MICDSSNTSEARRTFAPFGRLHTFDILIHLLETVRTSRLVDHADRTREVASLSLPSWHRRWHVAWQFLMSENFIERENPTDEPFFLRLSEEGVDLLEELRGYRMESRDEAATGTDEPEELRLPLSFEKARGTEFQDCIYRVIEAWPAEHERPLMVSS